MRPHHRAVGRSPPSAFRPRAAAPRPPLPRPSPRRPVPPSRAAADGSLATGGGGGGGGGRGGSAKRVGERDDDDDGRDDAWPATATAIVAKFGPVLADLPADMAAALSRGALTLGDVRRWVALARTPLLGALARAWPGFRDRVLGNPRFLLVLAIEEAIGCSARMAGEVRGRGDRFWDEIAMVASDMSLEVLGDFAIVWLLSPRASFAARPDSAFARALRSLPAHSLQVGSYSLAQRVGVAALRGVQFFGVGYGAATVGHTLTLAAVDAQAAAAAKRGEKPRTDLAQPAGVGATAAAWGWFMGVSSNVRYQLVNGFEERVLDVLPLPAGPKAAATFLMRFGNTYLGTLQWMWWAKQVGVQ